jgi:hypothetical protein
VGTTIDTYAHVDREAMVRAVAAVEDQARAAGARQPAERRERYAFHYDPCTVAELDAIASPRVVDGRNR